MNTSPPIVVGLGELLWDCFDESRKPGGAPANVAFHAQQLGHQGVICSRVGTDEMGTDFCDFLDRQGLRTDYIQRDSDHATGQAIVISDSRGHTDYRFTEEVAWEYLAVDPASEALMQRAAAVCFGTLAQRCSVTRQSVQHYLSGTGDDCLRVYDVNLRKSFYTREIVEQSLRQATVVKLNDAEVRILSRLLEVPARDTATFCRHLQQQFGVEIVCVTKAEAGCELYSSEDQLVIPGVKIELVDAVGAGDAFTAGFITGRLRGWSLEQSGEFANRVGALVAGHQGAMPVLENEFATLLEEYA